MNSVILIGRLTADPVLRTTLSGKEVCSFAIAVGRPYSDKNNKNVDFINIVAWESTANFICRYFKKGSMIAVQGSIQTRNYEGKDGSKRTAFEIIAKEVSFCESKVSKDGIKNENASPTVSEADSIGFYSNALPRNFEELCIDEDFGY